jgi:hypothetical protein
MFYLQTTTVLRTYVSKTFASKSNNFF